MAGGSMPETLVKFRRNLAEIAGGGMHGFLLGWRPWTAGAVGGTR
jgi:hypothetical protein